MNAEITDPKLKTNFELIKQASGSFSPATVLESVKQRFEPQALAKGLTFYFSFSFDKQAMVHGDPVRLDQILNNVLNNAVKFTTRG